MCLRPGARGHGRPASSGPLVWSLIAGHLPGRTDNEIKNYWNSHISRRASDFRSGGEGVIVDVDLSKLPGGGKRRGGRASRGGAAKGAKEKKGKGKGKGKEKGKEKGKAEEVEQLQQQQEKGQEEQEAMNVSTPSSRPCTTESDGQAQASASGVTSDGLEEEPLGLSEEMVSALLGPVSPKLQMGSDGPHMNSDSGPHMDSENGPSGPAGDVAQDPVDKAMEDWDLTGLDLDISTSDDMWDSLMLDYDDMVALDGGQQGEAISDLFFLDDM